MRSVSKLITISEKKKQTNKEYDNVWNHKLAVFKAKSCVVTYSAYGCSLYEIRSGILSSNYYPKIHLCNCQTAADIDVSSSPLVLRRKWGLFRPRNEIKMSFQVALLRDKHATVTQAVKSSFYEWPPWFAITVRRSIQTLIKGRQSTRRPFGSTADPTILLWRRVISTEGKQYSWAFALPLATLPVYHLFPCENMRVQGSANARRMPVMIAHLTWMIYLGQSRARAHHALQPRIMKLVKMLSRLIRL